jgi:hypothetical protein
MSQANKSSKHEIHPQFPVEPILGFVSGMQPKLLLRKGENGNFVSTRRTTPEIMERFEICDHMVEELKTYFLRKKRENADWSDEKNLERIRLGLLKKVANGEWHFTEAELAWIMDQVRERCSLSK